MPSFFAQASCANGVSTLMPMTLAPTCLAQAHSSRLAVAESEKAKGLAEDLAMEKKAEAWKNFNEAAVLNMVVDKMPELAQAFATQLAGIDKINIIEMGNGAHGSSGVGKVMGTVGGGMTAMLAMLRDQFGIDVARLMQAKTDAAAVEAEQKVSNPQSGAPPQ